MRAKPLAISKSEVYEAWKRVKANKGCAGVDEQSLEAFEADLRNNLYKLWNRLASGSYFPGAVKRVEIPKIDGSRRPLGIPTIRDRIAQEVVRVRLNDAIDPIFHEDSYGYRAGKSAIEAVKTARQRNFEFDWVLDLDIRKFFDSIRHDLLLKAVRHHASEAWVVLYVERFLQAPTQYVDGRLEANTSGTPQGGVISPLLANLYLHYAFDMWMSRHYPEVKFERYADDVVIHCRSEQECDSVHAALASRLTDCGLSLHPQKTHKVYCKDSVRQGSYDHVSYTFLGYTFQPRAAQKGGRFFTAFSPTVSRSAQQGLRRQLRQKRLFRQTHLSLRALLDQLNPLLRGWINYFKHFRLDGLYRMFYYVEGLLIRWFCKKFRINKKKAIGRLGYLRRSHPCLFGHWYV